MIKEGDHEEIHLKTVFPVPAAIVIQYPCDSQMLGIHTCAADPKEVLGLGFPHCESRPIDEP
jgi:hypothetical protein